MDTQIPFTVKKSKVTGVSFKKEWKGRDGAMFDFNLEFENGDKGVYQSNKREQDTFKIGIETDYSIESRQRGTFTDIVIKYVPQNRSSGGGRGKNFEKNYKCDHISYAASYTKDLFVAGKVPDKMVGTQKEKMKFAELFEYIYSVMDKKLNEINNTNATPSTTNETEQK